MLRRLAGCLMAIGTGALLACGSERLVQVPLEVRDSTALFQTDSLVVRLTKGSVGYQGTISATFRNSTSDTVYFVNCNGGTDIVFERRSGSSWTLALAPGYLLCLSPPITVVAGGTHRFTLAIFGGYKGSNVYPQFSTDTIPGEYRLVWNQAFTSYQPRLPFGDSLAVDQRRSNGFQIVVE